MKKNVGTVDKMLRLLIVLAVVVLILGGHVDGVFVIALGLLAVVMAVTSMTSFCPLYLLMGVSTCRAGACCCSCSCSADKDSATKEKEPDEEQQDSCCDKS